MVENNRLSVAVIGASDRPDRYSFKAIHMLQERGHVVLPISPRTISLPGLTVYPTILDAPQPVHTVTLYVSPKLLESLADDIIAARPKRVIFNPGTEHPEVEKRCRDAGIKVLEACTLVLLSTGQFAE